MVMQSVWGVSGTKFFNGNAVFGVFLAPSFLMVMQSVWGVSGTKFFNGNAVFGVFLAPSFLMVMQCLGCFWHQVF